MKIIINQISLLNFKGVRNLTVDFGNVTNITGDNGTGKTSVFDAFTWCLFGKNSEDAKDFNIKTLDKENNPIHKLEHSVSVTLAVDEKEMSFKRVYKEKWVKKKGEEIAEFTGHETTFFVDDVPLSQNEFKSRVDFIMNESIAKMITSPTYFNSLKWQDRRAVLEAMAGTISNEDIAADNKEFQKLLSQLGSESLINFKKKIAAKKALLKASLETLPTRIDEAQRNMPEVEDNEAIEKEITLLNKQLEKIDKAMEDKTHAFQKEYEAIQDKQREKFELEKKLAEVQNNAKQGKIETVRNLENKLRSISADIKNQEAEVASNNRAVSNNNNRINTLTADNEKLRADWTAENSRTLVIDEHAFNCPTCKQLLPEGEVEEMRANFTTNFNADKAKKLETINKKGSENKAEIERLKTSNETFNADTKEIEGSIENAKVKLIDLYAQKDVAENAPEIVPAEVTLLKQQISKIEVPESPKIDNSDLKEEKAGINTRIDALKQRLSSKGQIEKINQRVKELQEEESKQAQELADLERTEFTIAAFSKAKIETIESRINGKFQVVKFKMFEQQINGGEVECCECMVNGVPYSDVNTAGKINAGIDIINALTEHYKINAPVFIDNRESIIRILDCKSQIINLIAKEDPKRKPNEAPKLTVTIEEGLFANAN